MRVHLGVVAAAAISLLGCSGSSATDPDPGPYPPPDGQLDPSVQARALGKGVNFGNELDATPDEGSWTGGQKIQEADFALAAAAGFDSVRLPVRFSAHALTYSPYTIDPQFLARVDQVVGWGLAHGLRVVIDVHHYEELHKSPSAHRRRFVALWQQIATHWKDAPDGVYYELLNEPNTGLNDDAVWNGLVDETLRAIRRIDPHHTIVVDCNQWSNPGGLFGLQLPPEETNAIVTFHYYSPTLFCFQGKQEWMGNDWSTTGITWPAPPAQPIVPAAGVSPWVAGWIATYNQSTAEENQAAVADELAYAAYWGEEHGRPLWMGEFTAQDGADLASRANWIGFVRTELERNGIAWSFWTLDTDPGTRLYDPGTGRWTTELTGALGLEVTNGP